MSKAYSVKAQVHGDSVEELEENAWAIAKRFFKDEADPLEMEWYEAEAADRDSDYDWKAAIIVSRKHKLAEEPSDQGK